MDSERDRLFKIASSPGRESSGSGTWEDAGMMRLTVVVTLSGLLLAAGPAEKVQDDRDDTQKLQGVWRGVELEIKGGSMPPPSARSMRLRFEQETFTIEQGGKITVQGRYTIDPASNPKTID